MYLGATQVQPFNQQKFFLGDLYVRLHKWDKSEQSLRYRKSKECCDCARLKGEISRANHRDQNRVRSRAYYQSPAGKATSQRARKKRQEVLNKVHRYPYSKKEVRQSFDGCCAYCGVKPLDTLHIEHFLCLAHGGTDTRNNVLPVCTMCNKSKANHNPMDWYFKQGFATKKRWKMILKALGKDDNNYLQLTLF